MAMTTLNPTPRLAVLGLWMHVVLGDEYCSSVVERALNSRKQVSNEGRQGLASAIDAAVKGISQFPKRPSIAPPAFLVEPVMHEMIHSDRLVGAVVRVWAESQQELHDLVVEHLDGIGMAAEYPDFSANELRGLWPPGDWDREIDGFVEEHDELDGDDAALMLCYVSGRVPDSSDDEDMDEEVYVNFPLWLDDMKALPFGEPEWEKAREFIASALEIIEEKEAERANAAALEVDGVVGLIGERFSPELGYLERSVASWSSEALPQSEVDRALNLVVELSSVLDEYRPIREPAPVRSEELVRAGERLELESRILSLMDGIDRLMSGEPDPRCDSPPPGPGGDGPETQPGVSGDLPDGGESAIEAGETPLPGPETVSKDDGRGGPGGEPDAGGQASDAVPGPVEQSSETSAEAEARSAVGPTDEALLIENEALHEEMRSLQNELGRSRHREKSWRLAYVEAARGVAQAGEGEGPMVDDVVAAVDLAGELFSGQLMFNLNSRSDVRDNPFEDAKGVLAALRWLATTYRASRMGEVSLSDPDSSIREACGWSYKSHQSSLTMSRYKDWYTTKVDGSARWLREHIGKGISKDGRHTIRIGFDWDRDRDAVIIGFIGQHQQTTAT